MREIRLKVEVSWTLEQTHSHAGKAESQTDCSVGLICAVSSAQNVFIQCTS